MANSNKMSYKTTKQADFKDFKVVSGKNLRSRSQEPIDENQALVIAEIRKVKGNNSKEFKSTLSFNSPFFNQSSYQNSFYNFGDSKCLNAHNI